VPYLLKEQYPQASVTAVELDPDVADLVLRQLPLSRSMPGPHPPVVHTGDARTYLRRHPQTYDYVFLDAYVGLYIPHHLITREFFALLAERLETDGVLVINVLALLDVDGFQNRLEATLRTVFPVTATLDVSYSANRVVYAFKSADRARAAVARAAGVPGESAELFRDAVAAAAAHPAPPVTPGARIFTDDRNDIDSILYKAQEHVYRFKKMF
jgi:spermidine synthase